MAHYSSRTAKRHYLYANTPAVLKLDKGKLVGWKNKDSKVKSAVKYVDGSGKQRYKGTEHLRATESLILIYLCYNCELNVLLPCLPPPQTKKSEDLRSVRPGFIRCLSPGQWLTLQRK